MDRWLLLGLHYLFLEVCLNGHQSSRNKVYIMDGYFWMVWQIDIKQLQCVLNPSLQKSRKEMCIIFWKNEKHNIIKDMPISRCVLIWQLWTVICNCQGQQHLWWKQRDLLQLSICANVCERVASNWERHLSQLNSLQFSLLRLQANVVFWLSTPAHRGFKFYFFFCKTTAQFHNTGLGCNWSTF